MPKSSDMVQSFSCEKPITLKYQLSHIRLIMKALAISTKVCKKIRITSLVEILSDLRTLYTLRGSQVMSMHCKFIEFKFEAVIFQVVLRCSSNGLLLLQLKLEKEDQRQMFSEFYIVPLLDD